MYKMEVNISQIYPFGLQYPIKSWLDLEEQLQKKIK